jgi:hypothetical protein
MQRNIVFGILLLLVGQLARDTHASDGALTIERFQGIARSESGAVVYTETHEVQYRGDRPQRSVTRYFDPAGKKIGKIVSDYSKNPYAPDYQFKDAKGGTLEAAELVAGGVRLRYLNESKVLPRSGPGQPQVVLGQGLHQLTRARMDSLADGKDLVVQFAIPSRLDSYTFRIERLDSSDANTVRLQIGIDNWVLSLLAPTLEVDYDRKTRRLMSYRGVSNLSGPNGETMKVTIRYQYPPTPSAAP